MPNNRSFKSPTVSEHVAFKQGIIQGQIVVVDNLRGLLRDLRNKGREGVLHQAIERFAVDTEVHIAEMLESTRSHNIG